MASSVHLKALTCWLAVFGTFTDLCQIVAGSESDHDHDLRPQARVFFVNDSNCEANLKKEDAYAANNSLVPFVCQATRYPELCVSSLSSDSRTGAAASSIEVVWIAMDLGLEQELTNAEQIQQLFLQQQEDLSTVASAALVVCEETLQYGSAAVAASRDSLLVSPIQDIRAWLSAGLQFQYDCSSALSHVPPVDSFAQIMTTAALIPQINFTMNLISNALCMTHALAAHGSDPSGWTPIPEARPENISTALIDSFTTSSEWPSSSSTFDPQPSMNFSPNVTVSQDGSANYRSVQQAVDDAPTYSSDRYVIYIREGVYNERVRIHQNKTRVTLIGDGVYKTILTGNYNASSPEMPTFQTATVIVTGAGFIGKGITFRNSAGPDAEQAVAIRVDGDESAFHDCSFDAYQDTLYAHTGRQSYENCTVVGTVDFIFGNAAAVFQNCQLLVRLNRKGSTRSFVTAQGRTDPGQATGFVFRNCTVTGTSEYMQQRQDVGELEAYLGRPWKLFSRTVFIDSYLDSLISPTGWFPWEGDFALNSLLYAEYGSGGPGGADLSSRVPWSNQLTRDQAQYFSLDNFIQASWWLPQASTSPPTSPP